MRHESDFVRLHMDVGTRNILCSALNMEWPPPERYNFTGHPDDEMVRTNMSTLTDDQIAGMSHVARGAEYVYARDEPS